jgi:general secretion pathway protein M
MVLSTREKLLVALLAVLLLGTGAYFGVEGLRERLAGLEERVGRQEALVRRAAALVSEAQRLEQAGLRGQSTPSRSLIGYVEQLADRVGVRDRIQLNLMQRDPGSDFQGLDIRVDRLSLDEMVRMLYTLENAEYRLMIDQLEISPSFRDKDLLRLSMRVLARQ